MTHCVEAIRKRRDLIEGLWGTTWGRPMWRRSPRLRFHSRQHSLEGDFDELFRKGQSRHTDQVAGALRARGAVRLLAHLACDSKRRIHIEDIERLLHDVVQRRAEARQKLYGVGVGRP